MHTPCEQPGLVFWDKRDSASFSLLNIKNNLNYKLIFYLEFLKISPRHQRKIYKLKTSTN